ncbi:ketopantoate reductase family protein [Leucobacter weissii]|uniref:Ketopantoate reductase family protein n=1 Tax=Leucobacter weissii TaxID=1983706 RepID=A0A939MJR3_9MICO|nr:ketopantoate reductase family protein [Leucobacter weissii]MBO1901520.1 ketopantoate reductase family protein [Leucobacter weissii]
MSDTQNASLRVAVLGTGANGSIIGADLANAGVDVTFIDQWPANVEAIREHGVRVQSAGETTTTRVPVHHLCEVAELREPFDVVLLLVKAYDTRWAVELITPLLHEDSVVVGVQNGMTATEIADIVGVERALGAVIEVTSAMYTPGVVERHSAHERCWFAIGALDPAAAHHVAPVADLLRNVGIVEETDDIQSAKWMKLVLNAAELVTSANLDLSISDCARFEGMREVMLEAGNEAIAVAQAHGFRIRPIFGMEGDAAEDPGSYVATILDELVANYILPHSRATVLQDWMKHRRSEVFEMNGEVARMGRRHGVPTPVNDAVVEVARKIEIGELTPSTANVALMRQALREPVTVPARVRAEPGRRERPLQSL